MSQAEKSSIIGVLEIEPRMTFRFIVSKRCGGANCTPIPWSSLEVFVTPSNRIIDWIILGKEILVSDQNDTVPRSDILQYV